VWFELSVPLNLGQGIFERFHSLDRCEFVGYLVEERRPLDSGLVAGGGVDRLDPYLAHFLPPAVPTGPRNLEALVGLGREDRVAKRCRKRPLRADLEREGRVASGAVHSH